MQINSINSSKNNCSFKGLMNNKLVLNSLEKIADHGATFSAGLVCLMAVGVRPLSIALSPDVDKENKQYAITNSVASGLVKFGIVEALAIPVENSLKKINKNPDKFLKPDTIKNLKNGSENILSSNNYNVATQLLKQGTNFITAIPKAMLTLAFIPLLMNLLFPKKSEKNLNVQNYDIYKSSSNPIFDNFNKDKSSPSFKGVVSNAALKGVSCILNNKSYQNIVRNINMSSSNVARDVSIATDLLLTGSFVYRTNKSKKIDENRKKPLIYNNVISTGAALLAGYKIDNLIQKSTAKFISKFSEANKNNPKLNKYIEGINILRPNLIFAVLYYGVLPIFSTFLSDKIDKHFDKNKSVGNPKK